MSYLPVDGTINQIYTPPSLQYSTVYPSRPESPMVSGANHFRVREVLLTSSKVRFTGALVGSR